MSSHVSFEEAEATVKAYQKIQHHLHKNPSKVSTDVVFFRRFKHIVPSHNYDYLLVREGAGTISQDFKEALIHQQLDSYIKTLPEDRRQIYSINQSHWVTARDEALHRHTRSSNINRRRTKLYFLYQHIRKSSLPKPFKHQWHQAITDEIELIKTIPTIGTSKSSKIQCSISRWLSIIDIEKTKYFRTIFLKYETIAQEILTYASPRFREPKTIGEAVDTLGGLSDMELKQWDVPQNWDDQTTLEPKKGAKLFQIILNRIALTDWKVKVQGQNSLNTLPMSHLIEFPPTRILHPKDIWLLPAHEIGIHARRAALGAQQACSILQRGVGDYLATEEGLAVFAERYMGEQWGGERLKELAARYIAVAMAVKVKNDNGGIKAAYSWQEIYNQLVDLYNRPKDEAALIVWRIARGTSLNRDIVSIPVGGNPIPLPEVFIKDEAYLRGYLEMTRTLFSHLPTSVGALKRYTLHARDIRSDSFIRWGYARLFTDQLPDQPLVKNYDDILKMHEQVESLGMTALEEVIDYFSVGKLSSKDLTDNDSWLPYLNWQPIHKGLSFSNLFKPKT